MVAVGARLRALRLRAGLTQERLADLAGLSTEAISLLERGRRRPRVSTLRLICDALELAPADRDALCAATVELTDHNGPPMPEFAGTLIGRTEEIAEGVRLLRTQTRLLTLVGPGGVGKTRLAVSIAVGYASSSGARSRWLPLSSVRCDRDLPRAVAGALGLTDASFESTGAPVDGDHLWTAALAGAPSVLILDNAEHLLDGVRELVATLLRLPNVRVVVTSRIRIGAPGERPLAVQPLALPPSPSARDLAESGSSALFLDRAGLAVAQLPTQQRSAVSRICQRLDGLPLAIELAASRTDVLSPAELARALSADLRLLGDDHRPDVVVDAVVGWTYRQLTEDQRELLSRMSVFSGFGNAAVAAVSAHPQQAVEGLAALLAHSLLVRGEARAGQSRFRMLTIIRDFARQRLEQPDDVLRRMTDHYLTLTAEAEPHLVTAEQDHWLAVLEAETPNIRTAITWACHADPVSALRLAGCTWRWSYLRGRYAEGRQWARLALAAAGVDAPPGERAKTLSGAGLLAFLQCDYAEATTLLTEAQALFESGGDDAGNGWCLARLGSIAREQGRYADAVEMHGRALGSARRRGDIAEAGAQANYLAFLAWLQGRFEDADRFSAEAMDAAVRSGDSEVEVWSLLNSGASALYRDALDGARLAIDGARTASERLSFREGIAWSLNLAGTLARRGGQIDRARSQLHASLDEHRELGDRWRMASVHDELAAVLVELGAPEEAAGHLGAADRLRRTIGVPVPWVERPLRQQVEQACRGLLGPSYPAIALAMSARSTQSSNVSA